GGVLESSLLQIYHQHNLSSLHLRQISEQAKKEAIRKAARVSDLLVDAVNGGVEECFINEKRIELEIRALAATVTQFLKQTDQWLLDQRVVLVNQVIFSWFSYNLKVV
ncbi:GCN5L1 domain-containing protein, partial [Cephalotus follicularis]